MTFNQVCHSEKPSEQKSSPGTQDTLDPWDLLSPGTLKTPGTSGIHVIPRSQRLSGSPGSLGPSLRPLELQGHAGPVGTSLIPPDSLVE